MNIRELISKWLKDRGYDGLCQDQEDGCGCLAADLFYCDASPGDCVPAYAVVRAEDDEIGDAGDVVLTTDLPKKRLKCEDCASTDGRGCKDNGLCWEFQAEKEGA